eukprot:19882-Heterococcus_DN1.PRE.7
MDAASNQAAVTELAAAVNAPAFTCHVPFDAAEVNLMCQYIVKTVGILGPWSQARGMRAAHVILTAYPECILPQDLDEREFLLDVVSTTLISAGSYTPQAALRAVAYICAVPAQYPQPPPPVQYPHKPSKQLIPVRATANVPLARMIAQHATSDLTVYHDGGVHLGASQVAQVVLGLPYEVTLLNMPRDRPSGQVPKDGVFDKVKGISTGTIALLTEYLQTGNVTSIQQARAAASLGIFHSCTFSRKTASQESVMYNSQQRLFVPYVSGCCKSRCFGAVLLALFMKQS